MPSDPRRAPPLDHAAPPIASPLLAAFANRGGLLAALIASEALAPPLALRETVER
ncbi:MAG: hypothetical protein ACREM6_17050 [Vulcanimicrobiaceae bacterium]